MRRALTAAAALALLVFSPARGQAQLFVSGGLIYCTNCSTGVQQLIDAANQVRQLEQQIMEVQYQIQSYQALVTNTISLPARLFNDVTGEIAQARGLVNQASLIGQQTKFMIDNLANPSAYAGFGGSLADIPTALAQENNALANAMQKLGLVQQQTLPQSVQCSTQAAVGDNGSSNADGIKGSTQAGNTIAATAAQCAENRFQSNQAAWNAIATANLRSAHREALLDAAAVAHLQTGVNAGCAALGQGGATSWVCTTASPTAAAPGTAVSAAPTGVANNTTLAAAVNAAPNTP